MHHRLTFDVMLQVT